MKATYRQNNLFGLMIPKAQRLSQWGSMAASNKLKQDAEVSHLELQAGSKEMELIACPSHTSSSKDTLSKLPQSTTNWGPFKCPRLWVTSLSSHQSICTHIHIVNLFSLHRHDISLYILLENMLFFSLKWFITDSSFTFTSTFSQSIDRTPISPSPQRKLRTFQHVFEQYICYN